MEMEVMQTMNSTTNQLLTETYASLCPILINYIYRRINDYESARDMAQDVFLRLMDYKHMLREETVRSMIFSIAHNLVIDYLRRYYRKQEMLAYFYEYGATVNDETESNVIANDILALEKFKLYQLSPQRRIVYLMNRFQNKTVSEISEELSLSRRTVENHLQTGRNEVREFIRQCI
jgi:RNA polymerase sigma factor (sigma-70 family)